MITCIHHSCASPVFAQGEWRASSQPTTLNEVEQRVFDLGFDLSALYEEDEASAASGGKSHENLPRLITQMDRVLIGLDECAVALEGMGPQLSNPGSNLAGFWDLESAVAVANIATLALDASICIHEMLERLGGPALLSRRDRLPMAPFAENKGAGWQDQLASYIVAAVTFMTRENMGLYGAQRSIFPLRMMLNILSPDSASYSAARELYVSLLTRNKLRHTESLDGLWIEEKGRRAEICGEKRLCVSGKRRHKSDEAYNLYVIWLYRG